MRDAAQRRLAVGFFDGVHLGHQAILANADAALTFRQHPLSVIAPERAPRLLMSVEERVAAIRACGVEDVTVLDFTSELAGMSAEDFSGKLVAAGQNGQDARFPVDRSGVIVRCGANWRFGAGGKGDAAFLRAHGIGVEVVGYAEHGGELVSSSRIRKSLEEGRVEDAAAMLGRSYEVGGSVVSGKGLGKELGCPTINIDAGRPLCLRLGVYAVELAGTPGIANYGHAPTMDEAAWPHPVLEVHLFGTVPDMPSERTSVRILGFLRDERKFASPEELKRQIESDCENVRGALLQRGNAS